MAHTPTPGPWIWEEGQPHIFREWNGKCWQVATVEGANLGWHEDGNSANRESGANAAQIAAAPDLATSLRATVRQLAAITRAYVNDTECREHTEALIEEARAVLRAAGIDPDGGA